MKYLILVLIISYQRFFSVILRNVLGINSSCRFSITCSEYARLSIMEKGALEGGYLFIKRLLSCQPFYRKNYDRSIYI